MCVWAQILCAGDIFGTQHDALKIFEKFEKAGISKTSNEFDQV